MNGKNTNNDETVPLGRKQIRNKNFESKDYEYIFNKFLGVKKLYGLIKVLLVMTQTGMLMI